MITIQTNNRITTKALKLWGIENQLGILQEECAECISAISRFNRKRTDEKKVAEEIADIIVSMMSVINGLGVEKEINHIMFKKLLRLNERCSYGDK